MSTEAALEAYCRFVRDDNFEMDDMLEPHFDQTRRRAEALGRMLVVHDTTEMSFQVHDEPARSHLADPTAARQAFLWHASLATNEWADDQREVLLSARPKRKAADSHPVRRGRKARLQVRATQVQLRRPNRVPADLAASRIEVGIVEVSEVDPPDDAAPVRWVLVTSEPIEEADQLWEVVDFSRARWTIEEYFKAIKTGTGYTDLQHRSAETLLKALAAKAVVAWNLLRLRYLGRNCPDADALRVINPIQRSILSRLRAEIMGAKPTAGDAMQAIADLGGHISNNDPPGWQVLGRGWKHLLELERGFRIAQSETKRCDQS